MRKFLVAMLVAVFMAVGGGVALGAEVGTLTIVSDTRMRIPGGSRAVRVIEWDWLSHTTGACSDTADVVYNVTGTVIGLHSIPETAGTIPSDNYDVVINDAQGCDILNGAGTDLNQTLTSVECYRFPADYLNTGPIFIVDQDLTLVVSNGGSVKGGVIRLYILLP